jgi:hypothetical protein
MPQGRGVPGLPCADVIFRHERVAFLYVKDGIAALRQNALWEAICFHIEKDRENIVEFK